MQETASCTPATMKKVRGTRELFRVSIRATGVQHVHLILFHLNLRNGLLRCRLHGDHTSALVIARCDLTFLVRY